MNEIEAPSDEPKPLKVDEVARYSKHSRLYYHKGRIWVWHTTMRFPWTLKQERRVKNKRARAARRLGR